MVIFEELRMAETENTLFHLKDAFDVLFFFSFFSN